MEGRRPQRLRHPQRRPGPRPHRQGLQARHPRLRGRQRRAARPYTGTTIHFTRGQNTSTAVQIDHIVALSDAWQKGAQQLSADLRTQLANDPLNLLAVDGPTNQQKSDGDAATWLPPNKAFRCTYVTHQVQVKAKYSLWVTQAEKAAITNQLGTCS